MAYGSHGTDFSTFFSLASRPQDGVTNGFDPGAFRGSN